MNLKSKLLNAPFQRIICDEAGDYDKSKKASISDSSVLSLFLSFAWACQELLQRGDIGKVKAR